MEHVTLGIANSTFPGETEIAGREEEHHQLPPYENVSEGRRAPEEGWQAWLSEFFLLDCSLECTVIRRWLLVKLNGGEGKRSIFGVWVSFFTVYQKVML